MKAFYFIDDLAQESTMVANKRMQNARDKRWLLFRDWRCGFDAIVMQGLRAKPTIIIIENREHSEGRESEQFERSWYFECGKRYCKTFLNVTAPKDLGIKAKWIHDEAFPGGSLLYSHFCPLHASAADRERIGLSILQEEATRVHHAHKLRSAIMQELGIQDAPGFLPIKPVEQYITSGETSQSTRLPAEEECIDEADDAEEPVVIPKELFEALFAVETP